VRAERTPSDLQADALRVRITLNARAFCPVVRVVETESGRALLVQTSRVAINSSGGTVPSQ
jgi:hypothetical protein